MTWCSSHGTAGQRETNASASLAGAVPPRQAPWRARARKTCAGHAGAGHCSQHRPCRPPSPWRTPLIQNLILHHLCRREETAAYSELRELLVVLKCWEEATGPIPCLDLIYFYDFTYMRETDISSSYNSYKINRKNQIKYRSITKANKIQV